MSARPKSAARRMAEETKQEHTEGAPEQVDETALEKDTPEQVKVSAREAKAEEAEPDQGQQDAPDGTPVQTPEPEATPEPESAEAKPESKPAKVEEKAAETAETRTVVPAQWDATDADFLPAQSR